MPTGVQQSENSYLRRTIFTGLSWMLTWLLSPYGIPNNFLCSAKSVPSPKATRNLSTIAPSHQRRLLMKQRRQLAESVTAMSGNERSTLASMVTSFVPKVIASATNSQS